MTTSNQSPRKPVMLTDVRLSFPAIFEPQKFADDNKPKFNATFLMAPDHPAVKAIKAEIVAVAKEKWPQKYEGILKSLKAANKLCINDGALKEKYEGFEGNLYVTASNKLKPKVFNRANEMVTEGCEGVPYAGCYVNATVEIWAMDNKFGKRINASLRGLQFVRDGEAFGGGAVAADDEFDALEEGADDSTDMGEGEGEDESVI